MHRRSFLQAIAAAAAAAVALPFKGKAAATGSGELQRAVDFIENGTVKFFAPGEEVRQLVPAIPRPVAFNQEGKLIFAEPGSTPIGVVLSHPAPDGTVFVSLSC